MPFENEFAKYEPLKRIVNSDVVKTLLSGMKIRKEDDSDNKINTLSKSELKPGEWEPDWVISIDGSYQATPVKNGFPIAEIGYITVASVITNLKKIAEAANDDFIDPKKMREAEETGSLDTVVPGTNVILDNRSTAMESFRNVLYNEFNRFKIFDDGESLLETYEVLLKYKIADKSAPRAPKCPVDIDICDEDYKYGYGIYKCKCGKYDLYSTDALRLHELMNPAGTNGELYGQVMQTIEKLSLINILRYFESKDMLSLLKRIVFIMDGPLAVFSTASWLAKPITEELNRINEKGKKLRADDVDLIIIGIEKTGAFVNHFDELDIDKDGAPAKFKPQSLFLLDDDYIKNNIVFSASKDKTYGQDTYYGRKFFYKNSSGYKIVGTVAFFNDYQKNIKKAKVDQFPRIADVMTVLDQLSSSMYKNSISPLITAHAEASIPLNLGKKILETLARELMCK
jgi:hypothetical protein